MKKGKKIVERSGDFHLALCLHTHIMSVNPDVPYGSRLTRSLREPGGPCTKSMEVSESRMERLEGLGGWMLSGILCCSVQSKPYFKTF